MIIMNAIGYTIGPSNVQLTVDPDSGRRPPVPEITTTSMNSTEQFLYINLAVSVKVGDIQFKGTHTVYFTISVYIINQKPMIPGTDLYCKTTRVACSSE